MTKRLQIENCKLQIANWRAGHCGRFGRGLQSAEIPRPAYTAATRRWPAFPICNLQIAICNLQFLFLLLLGSLAFAADLPPSTDDQLRDSLNSKTGDDYDRALLGDPAKPDDKDRVDDKMQKKLQKELGAAAEKEGRPKDPLLQVAEEMRDAQKRILQRDSGDVTQYMQRQIVADLAKLIEQAKKSGSCSGSKNPSGRKPTASGGKKPAPNTGQPSENSSTPAQVSNPKIRKPEDVRAEAAANAGARMKDLWAELPARDRERMLELPGEHFLPGYELEIEDYFRRLSEEQHSVGRP